jgi:hypothetical protein
MLSRQDVNGARQVPEQQGAVDSWEPVWSRQARTHLQRINGDAQVCSQSAVTPQGMNTPSHGPDQHDQPQQSAKILTGTPDQNTEHHGDACTLLFSGHTLSHSTAHTIAAAESSKGGAQRGQRAADEAAVPVPRRKKISIKIKGFRVDHSVTPQATQASHAALESLQQQNGAGESAQHTPESGVATKPSTKRKGRHKGTSSRKQKTDTVQHYLMQAQQLVKGSYSRLLLLSQLKESSVSLLLSSVTVLQRHAYTVVRV